MFVYLCVCEGPELLSKFVGDSEASLRRLFSRASFFSPSLIFFDEIDALCGSRGGAGGGGSRGGGEGSNKVEERMIAQLLTELDGISDRGKVYLVAATNRPDMIDPALLRPGRLEVRVYVHLPDQRERAEILRKGWSRLKREQKEEREKHRQEEEEEDERVAAESQMDAARRGRGTVSGREAESMDGEEGEEKKKENDADQEQEEKEEDGSSLDFDMIASMTERYEAKQSVSEKKGRERWRRLGFFLFVFFHRSRRNSSTEDLPYIFFQSPVFFIISVSICVYLCRRSSSLERLGYPQRARPKTYVR